MMKPGSMMNDNDKMHPDDRRNLIIFVIAAFTIWFLYDTFLLKPKVEALRAVQAEAAKQAQEVALVADDAAPAIRPRADVIGEAARVKIDNGALFGSLSLTGNRIDDLSLKKYFATLEKKDHVVLLSPAGTDYPKYAEFGWLPADDKVAVPGKDTVWRIENGAAALSVDQPLVMSWSNGQGIRYEREFSIDKDYMIKVTQRVANNSGAAITLYPYSLISGHGLPQDFEGNAVVHEGSLGYIGDELVEHSYKDMAKEGLQQIEANTGWIGITEKYWFSGLIPPQNEVSKFRFVYTPPQAPQDKPRYQVDIRGDARVLEPGQAAASDIWFFSGAKEVKLLERYEGEVGVRHLDLAVDFGLLYFLTKPFFYLLDFFGRVTGNFGVAILLLTVIVRLLVFPLANTTYRSFAKLRTIAPQMHELRTLYGEDRERLQKELVALYEREKVNPMAGCVPILIQIPIFFALYKILSVTIEMRQAPFFGWIQDLSARDPTSVFNLFGLLPYDVPEVLQIGAWSCLMLFFMVLQKKMSPPSQDKMQKFMMEFFPYFITYILSSFSAGLVIYWTLSNALSILQQYIIMRSMGVEVKFWFGKPKDQAQAEKDVQEGPVIHPELELLEKKAEDALFGDHENNAGGNGGGKVISLPKPKKKKKK